MLSIHLLGRFEVLRDGVPLPPQAWRRRRPADLLKLIALSPDHRLARDRVIDTLWPDKDPGAGANNLHRALYDLRLVLGGRWVDIEGAYVVLQPDCTVDVDAFEAAVTTGGEEGRRTAVTLYRGDLAPEDPESPWLQTRRRLLRTRFAEVAGVVAHEAAARGEAPEAVTILRRLLAADPAAEEGHRLLMELLAAGGSRSDALRQYDEAVRALRAAGRGLPGEPLRRLRDAIERREVGPAVTPAPVDGARRASQRLLGVADPPPLRGRKPQLDSATALLAHGSGVLVLLGEAGVGKTRFAIELARVAQQRGTSVLAGSACTLHPSAPFAPFAAAFADEAREVPTAPPNPFEADASAPALQPDAERTRLFGAVAHAIAAAGRGGPVLLLLDDLHAADESSLNLLHYLALRAATLQLTVIATCRETAIRAGAPIQTALAHLDADRLARGLRLPRLALAASAERLADVLADPPPPEVVARICQVTDGNPFLIEQVAQAWHEGGRQAVPDDPASALRTRLARLDDASGRFLAAAAVIGNRFSLDLAAHAAGLERNEALSAFLGCVEARYLRDGSAPPCFAGTLVREEVLASLDPALRASLHRAVAQALEAAAARPGTEEAPADELAWHWREGFDAASAFRHLVAAGHRASACGGTREALGFHEAALALANQVGFGAPSRYELLESIGRGRLALGELGGAVDAFHTAEALEVPGGSRLAEELRGRTRRCAALAAAVGGDLAASHREIDLGLAAADGGEEQAGLLLLRARLRWHEGRFELARAAAEEGLAEAQRLGQVDLIARGRELVALSRAALGEEPALPAARTGPADRRHADPLVDPAVDASLILWDGALSGDVPSQELLRLATLELSHCRARADGEGAAIPLFATGSILLSLGDVAGAILPLEEALQLFRSGGSTIGEALALERLGVLRDRTGRMVEGMELEADGLAVAERSTLRHHLVVRLLAAQARNRLAAGSLHDAETIAREAADAAVRHGLCAVCETSLRPLLVRIALDRDRPDDADREARLLEALADARGGRLLRALARLTRARISAATGRKDEALGLLAEAQGGFEALGRRYGVAQCARAAGRLGSARDAAAEALLATDLAYFA